MVVTYDIRKTRVEVYLGYRIGVDIDDGNSSMVWFTVQVESRDKSTYFEGLFVQARTVQSNSYETGSFDVLGDSHLQLLTCGNTTTNVSPSHARASITTVVLPRNS